MMMYVVVDQIEEGNEKKLNWDVVFETVEFVYNDVDDDDNYRTGIEL